MQHFIIGLIFGLIGIPLLSCLSDLIYSFTEKIKSSISVSIVRNNKTIEKINNNQEETIVTNPIGFIVAEEAQEEWNYMILVVYY